MVRKRSAASTDPAALLAFRVDAMRDPDTGEGGQRWTFDLSGPHSRSDFNALRRALEALTPAGRLASLRARAEALSSDLPERRAMLAELDQAEHALAAFPGEFFRVNSFLIRASGLWERAKRREAARAARAVRVRVGQAPRPTVKDQHEALRREAEQLIRQGTAHHDVAAKLAKRSQAITGRDKAYSVRQVRRILKS